LLHLDDNEEVDDDDDGDKVMDAGDNENLGK
jgi:hypothetical protein